MEEPPRRRDLSRADALELLASASLGRVILSAHALPTAVPVNYVLDGRSIVFRSGDGMKLSTSAAGTVVAFQVDDFDSELGSGWSVVATGIARHITEAGEVCRLDALGVPTWEHPAGDLGLIRMDIGALTSRWLRAAPHQRTP